MIDPSTPANSRLTSDTAVRTAWPVIACVTIALTALNVVIYWQTLGFGIVDFDDPHYVGPLSPHVSHGLTVAGVQWALTTQHIANWHPLTWLSLMLDRTIVPEGWGVFHFTNTLLHAINSLLLLGLMNSMTRRFWPSALVAAIFAVHPLHVESVVWISERKDVLSTMFGLLAIWAYVQHARRGGKWLAITNGLLILSLMAKPMLVTFPALLLLLDFWPLRRITLYDLNKRPRSDGLSRLLPLLLEKRAMLVIIIASCVLTWIAQHAAGAVEPVPLSWRVKNAVISWVRYVGMTVWPDNLAMNYPRPGSPGLAPWPMSTAVLCAVALLAVTLGLLTVARRAPWAIVGWLWFVGTLTPVIGLVQAGPQALADRYMYVPMIGLTIIFAWTMATFVGSRRWLGAVVGAMSCIWIIGLALEARQQAAVWRDTDTLFMHALAVTENNYRVHEIYGMHLMAAGRFAEAQRQFEAAVELGPSIANARVLLGRSLAAQQRWTAAEREFKKAIELRKDFAPGHFEYGRMLAAQGRTRDALPYFKEAARLDPDNAEYRQAIGEKPPGRP